VKLAGSFHFSGTMSCILKRNTRSDHALHVLHRESLPEWIVEPSRGGVGRGGHAQEYRATMGEQGEERAEIIKSIIIVFPFN